MEILMNIINTTAHWFRDYISVISLSFIATALVIYGNNITFMVKKQIGGLNFFLKVTLFIIFCAFGFSLITSFLTPLLNQFLSQLDNIWLVIIILASFYGLGFIAQKKRLI